MKIDFLDVLADSFATLIGRIIATAFAINLGMGLGLYFNSSTDYPLGKGSVTLPSPQAKSQVSPALPAS